MIHRAQSIIFFFRSNNPILNLVLIIALLYQIILHFCIPVLPHYLNDPAWYFMYLHYFTTGEWIQEELYPSFHQPVLYYSSLGYSVAHYITYLFSRILELPSATLLSHLQFILYLTTARMVFLLTRRQAGQQTGLIVSLAFFWFIPFFNYAHLAMSETWFIAGFLFVIFLFDQSIQYKSKYFIAATFTMAGYIFLVRPIAGVLFPILIFLFLFFAQSEFKLKTILLSSVLFFCFPVTQSVFNKIEFNTWNLREGFGWNLWNRVIFTDNHFPEHSTATIALAKKLNLPDFVPSKGHWWEVTSQLSNLGLQPHEIQDFYLKVDLEGINEYSLQYTLNTLKFGILELPFDPQDAEGVFPEIENYKSYIINYRSKHHMPLVIELEKQNFNFSAFRNAMLSSYNSWNNIYSLISKKLLYYFLNTSLWIGLILQCVKKYKGQFINPTFLLMLVLPFAISIGSCAFEVLHDRYFLPGILLELMATGILISSGVKFLIKSKIVR